MKHIRKINESAEDLKSELSLYLSDISDEGFQIDFAKGSNENNILVRIWKPITKGRNYGYENSLNFDWKEVDSEIRRAFIMLREKINYEIQFIYTISDSITSDGYKRNFWDEEEFIEGNIQIWKTKSFMLSLEL